MVDNRRCVKGGWRRAGLPLALAAVLLGACSGVDVVPDATETFAASHYTRYAWRSDPPQKSAFSRDIQTRKSPSIRAGVEEQMSSLGYERVEREDAEFLIEYAAVRGFNDGQLSHGGSNDMLYGSSVNREIDGASVDNHYALSGPVETGEMQLVFIDARTVEVLWRVHVSLVVSDWNRVNHEAVKTAVRKAVAVLPPAS